jgi:hypothetical protein
VFLLVISQSCYLLMPLVFRETIYPDLGVVELEQYWRQDTST